MRGAAKELDVKSANRIKVMKYIVDHEAASRQELAQELGFSMPTIFKIVNDLMEQGMICEDGEYCSTGGRRAKILKVCPGAFCTAGAAISKNHLRMVLMDAAQKIIDSSCLRLTYEDTLSYYTKFGELVRDFLDKDRGGQTGPILGVGMSMPGIMDIDRGMIHRSLILDMTELSLEKFAQNINHPVYFFSNKNTVLAEVENKHQNVVYLTLGDTVGGGAYLDGEVYKGDMLKSMLFGHITIVPGGRQCYCGKQGCLDAYCSATALREESGKSLEEFFAALEEKDSRCEEIFDSYLEHLAIAVANLRMIFDCRLIIGGQLRPWLGKYLPQLEEKVLKYVLFDKDMSFVSLGKYGQEIVAVSAALMTLEKCVEEGSFLIGFNFAE